MSDASNGNGNGKRMKLGRNQLIACVAFAATMAMSYALVWTGNLTGPEWLGFAQVFVPVSVGTILGVGAAVKSVQALAARPGAG